MAAKVAPLDRPECVSIVPEKRCGSKTGGVAKSISMHSRTSRTSGQFQTENTSEGVFLAPHVSEGQRSTGTQEHGRSSYVHAAQHRVRWFYVTSGWYESPFAVSIRKFIRSKGFQAVAMVALLVALFGSDIFLLAQVPTNTALDIILTVTLLIFCFEFFGLTLTEVTYVLSFFFWMDLLGTVSIVLDLSYTRLGADAGLPERLSGSPGTSTDHVIIVRAARAAKLGARAGRLSRVLKLLRYMPMIGGNQEQKDKQVKVAKIISNQLTNVLSTRVSFLTICIVLVLPIFGLFTYPEMDESMSTWTKLLATTAKPYCRAVGDEATRNFYMVKLSKELRRFALFYNSMSYGPYEVCCGGVLQDDMFVCDPEQLQRRLEHSKFRVPSRRSSIRYVSYDGFQAFFDLQTPRQYEAVASISLICFVIVAMCCFSMVISSNISIVVLNPLERMLAVVRHHCMQIFKYTNDLKHEDIAVDEQAGGEFDDTEQSSEFVILEKVIGKLAVIADISTQKQVEAHDNMTENDVMVMNWMQGVQQHRTGKNIDKEFAEDVVDHEVQPAHIAASRMRGVPSEAINTLGTWDFNSLDMSTEELVATATYIVYHRAREQWTRNHVQEVQVFRLMTNLSAKYLPNPFHSFSHAIDVVYTVSRFEELIDATDFMHEAAPFWLAIAACGHDVGHIGVNNQYLIETSHALAVKYNDRSPLENMHCATLFQVLGDSDANVFARTDRNLYKDFRRGMIEAILHTDVTKHNEMIKELNLLYQMNSEAFDEDNACDVLQSQANIQLITNALLHTADVNNPMKPWDLAYRIAYLCIDEFFAQGDLEKAAGIPVQMLNDRDKVNRPNSQLGFIEFFIAPMTEPMLSIFPQLHDLADHLSTNVQSWFDLWKDEHSPSPEAISKLSTRVQKVSEKLLKLAGQADET